MSNPNAKHECPHCREPLKRIELPDNTGWDAPFHLVCFNDECSYYKDGWDWMMEKYEVKASYRYRINPETGNASPIAVWSATALRDRIVEDDE